MEGLGGHPWSGTVGALWGKTGEAETWLPLWRHLEDAAHVAGLLWDHWLPMSVKAHIAAALPGGLDDGRVLLTWLAGIHDIGKATPAFQIKARPTAPHLTDRLRDVGLDLDVPLADTRHAPHGALGHVLLLEWLRAQHELGTPSAHRAAKAIAVAVGAHHGVLAGPSDLERLAQKWSYRGQTPIWAQAQAELLDGMAHATGADERLPAWLTHPLPPTVQALLAATVVAADWLASDEHRFPYLDRPPDAPGWGELGLPTPWRPAAPPKEAEALLKVRFPTLAGHSPTPIQHSAVEAAWAAEHPPLLLLEAEMGSGKTEAGLAAAEVLAHRFGQGGVFVALPTMATSDAMFARVRAWIDHLPADDTHLDLAMFLAHGKAGLNDDYRSLPDDARITGVYDDDGATGAQTAAVRHAVAVTNSWTRGRRRGVLAPFVVGTIDQVLFGALRSKHLALRHLALAGKVIVIDEVHAADDYMRQYLTSALAWLGAYGTPVVLMSATLPPAQRDELVAAYAEGARRRPAAQAATASPAPLEALTEPGYPRTLLFDGATRSVPTAQRSSRPRTVVVQEQPDDLDRLVATLREELRDGGCLAVIRNTVRRAQETWDALRAAFPDVEVVLVHSRFVAVDRAHREADLRRRLGPSGLVADGTRPHALIVVGTQVLEQSLDIDVDLMVSDLAPVDLLLQRVGRLHRHTRGVGEVERPARLRIPRLLLLAEDWESSPVRGDRGSGLVYGESRLLRAAATLRAHGPTIRLADDIPHLVESAYDPDLSPPAGWADAMAAADATHTERVHRARARAGDFRLSDFARGSTLRKTGGVLADCGFFEHGDPDDGNGGRSQVRDSEDSIEVVVVRRVDGLIRPMPGCGLPADTVLATDFPPEPRIARALAACTVRLPSWALMRDPDAVITALEDTSFTGWQQDCPWLQGQLVLVLDLEGRARVADLDLAYDSDTGLTVTAHREDS